MSDDMDGFRVNMSDQEAKSADREPLPAGKFHYKITDMEISYTRETAKNANKPYINFEFTVQDGQYSGRKDWTNAMCFEPALYTISQILKSLGMNVTAGTFTIPRAREFYIGKDIWGSRRMNKKNKDSEGNLDPRIELMGFSAYTTGESTAASPTDKPSAKTAAVSVLP